jgi:hypothetical protein
MTTASPIESLLAFRPSKRAAEIAASEELPAEWYEALKQQLIMSHHEQLTETLRVAGDTYLMCSEKRMKILARTMGGKQVLHEATVVGYQLDVTYMIRQNALLVNHYVPDKSIARLEAARLACCFEPIDSQGMNLFREWALPETYLPSSVDDSIVGVLDVTDGFAYKVTTLQKLGAFRRIWGGRPTGYYILSIPEMDQLATRIASGDAHALFTAKAYHARRMVTILRQLPSNVQVYM